MAGFRVDMSPLVNSSINQANAYGNIGQALGGALQSAGQAYAQSQQQQQQQAQAQQQQDAQAALNDLTSQAMGGNPEAFQRLMAESPQEAQRVAEYLQQQQVGKQQETDRFTSELANATSGFVEQLHLAPPEQQEAMFNAAVNDERYDIDEEDRAHFMDNNARRALVSQVKGEDYAENFFGKVVDSAQTKFQQGTGDMSGYVFNPDAGTFSINQELKAKLEEIKSKPTLDFKDRQSLNKDFTNLTKDTKLIRNTAKDLDKLATIKSGPAALAMVFKFMKALDPTSVVREGEQANAENSAGVPEAIRNMYNKVMSGARLGDAQMQQFVFTAKSLANSAIDSSETEISGFLDTFEDTIPKGFRDTLLKRIPARFDISPKEDVNPTPEPTPKPAQSTVNWSDL